MFSLVIPFHSDYERVKPVLQKLLDTVKDVQIEEILLCHNGPNLEALKALEPYTQSNIKLLHTPDKGIGAAYRLGIENASQPYLILSASDLPFGFSDLNAFLLYNSKNGVYPELAVGSKLHRNSDIKAYPLGRKIYSYLFYLSRLIVLGYSTPRDSQGTILGSSIKIKESLSQVHSKDYFFSLELLTVGSARGLKIVELPVVLENHQDKSSVAPIGDGFKMLARLFELRRKVRSLRIND